MSYFKEGVVLMDWQKDILHKSEFHPDLFLACSMGVGKSCATIQMICARFTERETIGKVLIIAPLITLKNWGNEFAKFSNIPREAIHVLKGSGKKRAKQLSEIKYGIAVTNYESFNSEELYEAAKEWKQEILVCDESHLLKNHASKRAKKIAVISDYALNRYLLTGTMILNGAMDVFQQFRILDGYLGKNSTFGNKFFVFRARYFEDSNASWAGKANHFPNFVPRKTTYKELNEKIFTKAVKVEKKDCLNLPPLVKEYRHCILSKEQERLYKELKRDFITYVEDLENDGVKRAVVARLAIVKALRLQQCVTGFVKTDDDTIVRLDKTPRLAILKELLQELTPNHKVIVWAVFKENYKQIGELCGELGIEYTEIHGGIKTQDKFDNMDKFNEDTKTRVLISNPSSGGVGINLVASDYSIYYSRSHKLGDYLQSEARNHRKGSEGFDRITHINLISTGTIDEIIDESLRSKRNLADLLLERKEEL